MIALNMVTQLVIAILTSYILEPHHNRLEVYYDAFHALLAKTARNKYIGQCKPRVHMLYMQECWNMLYTLKGDIEQ